MKKIIALLSLLIVVIIACTTSQKSNNLLSKPGDVKADEYSITIDRDTTLVTKNGALLKIPKGALATDNGNTVDLEIKEAYSLEQMIKYGLTTSSGDEPLSSGGMIYINAKAGQNVTIKQAIKVAIPTDYLSPGMQLFKGEETQGGNINWIEPTALPENQQLNAIEKGKQLFESNCASCHAIGKDMTGPDLAHFKKRFPEMGEGTWRYYDHGIYADPEREFERSERLESDSSNSDHDRATNGYYHYDPYYIYKCNLTSMYGTRGPRLFTDTSNSGLQSIYNYIQNESNRRKLPLPGHAGLFASADSCNNYTKTINNLKQQKMLAEIKRNDLVKQNGATTSEERKTAAPNNTTNGNSSSSPSTPPPPSLTYEDRVSPENNDAVFYQFTIETFGWYNIDILMKDFNGAKESELFVRIVGAYREKVQVYLIIPSAKVYVQGGPAERNKEEYAFVYKNGKIFLPQDVTAYIMAVTETESSIAYSVKEFNTGIKQELELSLQLVTKEEFNTSISRISGNDISISVKDAKNASEIRKTVADLKTINEELKKAESLKPKNCDCDCWKDRETTPSADEINEADILDWNK